jgi:hypothetical protein
MWGGVSGIDTCSLIHRADVSSKPASYEASPVVCTYQCLVARVPLDWALESDDRGMKQTPVNCEHYLRLLASLMIVFVDEAFDANQRWD